MNQHLIRTIVSSIITEEDRATGKRLQERYARFDEHLSLFSLHYLNPLIEKAAADYIENQTTETLRAYEDAFLLREGRKLVGPRFVLIASDAQRDYHAASIVPWQLDILNRILPAAREFCEDLVRREKRHVQDSIGLSVDTNTIIREARATIAGLERLLIVIPQSQLPPDEFLMMCAAPPDFAEAAEPLPEPGGRRDFGIACLNHLSRLGRVRGG